MKIFLSYILLITAIDLLAADKFPMEKPYVKVSSQKAFEALRKVESKRDVVFATLKKDINESYNALETALPAVEKTGEMKLLREFIRVAVYVSSIDPSPEVGQFLAPLYDLYPAKFEIVLRSYSAKVKKRIINRIESSRSEGADEAVRK